MKNIFNKANVSYYIAGALATFTLLASGVFAAAPYIGFLAPVAALSVGLPFIIGGAVFSAVAMALSYKAISKNKTISEKEAQLANQAKEIEGKDKIISEKEAQLSEKEAEVKAKEKDITVKDDKLAKQVEEIEGKGKTIVEQKKLITEKDKKIEEDALKVEIVDNAAYVLNTAWDTSYLLAKEAAKGTLYAYNNYIPSTESAKGALGSGVKNICDASITFVRGALNSVGSSLYSRLYGTKVSGPEEQFKREDGSKPSMQELTRLDYLDLAVPSSEQKQRANSLDYLSIDNVPKQPGHSSIDAAKRYLMSLSEDQNVFYGAESGDAEDTEASSPESQPTKEENGQGWDAWGKAKVAKIVTAGIGLCSAVLYYAAPYIPTVLNEVVASPMDNSTSVNNGTCPNQ